jgi:hypothetical protein
MRALTFCLWLCGAALAAAPAFAWGGDNHRVICAIAWEETTPAARMRIEDLLGQRGRDAFADSCLWADEYRDQGHRETETWHYVNVPPGATAIDLARDCKEPPSCILAQIDRQIGVLRGKGSTEEKAMALKFLGHFVGDLHQPLHAGHAEDRRGGAIKGQFLGQPYDFHWLWDNGLTEALHRPWHDMANELRDKVTAGKRREWTASKPIDWANESLTIANLPETDYVDHGKPFDLGADYQRKQLPIIYDRLSRAGVRLGNLLTQALDSNVSR